MISEVNGVLVAAHDLKAPLTLIRQLALSLELAEDLATRESIQNQIIGVSERALKQVNDFAKIARLEDGLFAMEPVSVRAVCDSVYKDLDAVFKSEHRNLQLSYTNRSRLATANSDLLHSIIYNFCTNAVRYSEPDSVSRLSVADVKNHIRVIVRDFGPSLPTRLWRELQTGRLARPTRITMRPGSSGLGLYIASEFASYMRAKLGAIRHRDGTSIFIDLPISAQATLF